MSSPGSPASKGSGSRQAVLREILLNEPITRREIAPRLGVDPATVSTMARQLIDTGLVQERMERPGERPVRPGRRFKPLEIDPAGGQVLGVAVAPTVQTVALADIGQNILGKTELRIEPIGDPDHVIKRIAHECRRLIGIHLEDRTRLLGGLLMATSVADSEAGTIVEAPYLGWGTVPIRARLADLLNLRMQIRMLLPTIARAEYLFGVARGRRNILAMLCGLGIGVAVIVDGRLIGKTRFPTGGIGMLEVIGEDGTTAPLDQLAGGLGVLRRLHGAPPSPAPLSQIDLALHEAIERDRAGDPQAGAEIARAGRELGRLAVQHGHFVTPDIVLIAGPLALAPSYLAAIRETVAAGLASPPEVVASCVAGAPGGWWASCAMAVYEYLVELPLERSGTGGGVPLPR